MEEKPLAKPRRQRTGATLHRCGPFLDHEPGHGTRGSFDGVRVSGLTAGSRLATFH